MTIAIAASDDEERIETCLRSALAQDYPSELVEVLVADAMSMDATREIVLRMAGADPRLCMLDNPQRTRAAAYALFTGAAAVRVARGEGFVTIPIAWAAYPVMHLAHGVGFGDGLVRSLVWPDWGPAPRIDGAVSV